MSMYTKSKFSFKDNVNKSRNYSF